MGALSKLHEFHLSPEIRTRSVHVPGISRNNNSEKREPTGDRSSNDPCPEVVFSACRTSNLIDSDQEGTSHMVRGVQEEIPIAPMGRRQESKRRRALHVSHNVAVETPLRQLKQTRFFWPPQLATNSNYAEFNIIIDKFSKLHRNPHNNNAHLRREVREIETVRRFVPNKFEKPQANHGKRKTDYLQSLMRGVALQTFKNITNLNRENFGEFMSVFCRKYVKPQAMAKTKKNFNDCFSTQRMRR